MGPEENKLTGELYFKTEDHDYVRMPAKMVNLTFEECIDHMIKDDEEAYKNMMTIRSTDTFRFEFHTKIFIKMSKKRFKKILMSKGLSRDDADFLCYLVGWFKGKVSFHEIHFGTLFLRPAVRFYEVFDYIMTKGEISEWTNIKQQMSLI